ncbi:MAG: PEP-CTERM sorting domain-containing protein [Planctomycetota bacterium]
MHFNCLTTGTAALSALLVVSPALAADVVGGQTNVALDTTLLSTAAGLDLSSVSADVISPGSLPGSVAFGINARDAAVLPTDFTYTPGTLAPFSGTIEHTGSVFFNNDTVEVGNFTIGFDANRVAGANSGFFVESTTGVSAILFDIGGPNGLTATNSALIIDADLLVSPEFAAFLGNTALTGADVGDAQVDATAVPEPGSAALLAVLGGLMVRRRRAAQ